VTKDERPAKDSRLLQEAQTRVREGGWLMIPGKVAGGLECLYTVGLSPHGHPEMVIVGLPREMARTLIETVVRRYQRQAIKRRAGEIYQDLARAEMACVAVTPRQKRVLGIAVGVLGPDIEALQIVWPDREGKYPWDAGVDPEVRKGQYVLGAPLRVH